MHPPGAAHDDTDKQRHGDDQSAQFAIGPSIRPTTIMPPTVLVARGDEPLFLQGWRDEPGACMGSADAVPLSREPTPRSDAGEAL